MKWPLQGEEFFRWRATEVSRLEAFSDAVFAITVTLLMMSLEVPRTFAELKETFIQLPVFAASFALLILLWYYHYRFFRRYALEDATTITLNAVLLFLILFYAFPLKFLFNAFYRQVAGLDTTIAGAHGGSEPILGTAAQAQALMIIYDLGFLCICLVFVAMYRNAARKADVLELNEIERLLTKADMQGHYLSAGISALSLTIAAIFPSLLPIAGCVYFLMGPVHTWHGARTARLVRRHLAGSC